MALAVSNNYGAYGSLQAVRFGCDRHASEKKQTHTGYKGHDYSAPPEGMNILQRFGEWAIRQYQVGPVGRFIHEKVYKAVNLRCGYAETGASSCSQYTLNEIRDRGFVVGCVKGFGRIMNCWAATFNVPVLKDWFRDDVGSRKPNPFAEIASKK